jgi:hypothetical protein
VKKRELDSVGVEPEGKGWVATPRQEKLKFEHVRESTERGRK